MANYIGVKCPVCKGKFAASDDIVVCPECGAPHHRNCYMEKGECVFAAEHINGKEWRPPAEDMPPPEEGATKLCAVCGASNPQDGVYCSVCGRQSFGGHEQGGGAFFRGFGPGLEFDAEKILYGGLSPEDKIGEETVRDLAGYIGPNAAYFLPRFKVFSSGRASISMNLSALFLGGFYYVYRKMNKLAILMLVISLLTVVPYLLYMREVMPEVFRSAEFAQYLEMFRDNNVVINPPTWEVNYKMANIYARIFQLAVILNVALRVFLASQANRLYYKTVTRNVAGLRETVGASMERTGYDTVCARSGGVRGLPVFIYGVFLAIALIQMINYTFRGIF